MENILGQSKHKGGKRPCTCLVSTDISDSTSCGTGKLDFNGFWEHPCTHGLAEHIDSLKEYAIRVMTNPPVYMIQLGLAPPPHIELVKVFGTSRRNAMERAGIE